MSTHVSHFLLVDLPRPPAQAEQFRGEQSFET
jgi:hypothetical protein